jgi:hypothetical protein
VPSKFDTVSHENEGFITGVPFSRWGLWFKKYSIASLCNGINHALHLLRLFCFRGVLERVADVPSANFSDFLR